MISKMLQQFAERMNQSVLALNEAEPTASRLDHFTMLWSEIVGASGEFESPCTSYRKTTEYEVAGYSLDESPTGKVFLNLFISEYAGLSDSEEPKTLSHSSVKKLFQRLEYFFELSLGNLSQSLEETDDAYEIADLIRSQRNKIEQVHFFVLTNSVFQGDRSMTGEYLGVAAKWEVWDLVRAYEFEQSAFGSELITINAEEWFGSNVQALSSASNENYRVFLLLLPGAGLARLYNEYGSKLMQQNVRSFLQVAGKVNKGIQKTINEEPQNFLTYNNGISAVASGVEVCSGVTTSITEISGFQIVNGGQTTASLAAAYVKDEASLASIMVQVKLTVVNPDGNEDLISNISKYSNTQNKVTAADFSVNSPFHKALEKISRETLSPTSFETGRKSYWYYERMRGQYSTDLLRIQSQSKKREFKLLNPLAQKFGPIELAKALNAWDQFPYFVSRGAQKNYAEFQKRLADFPSNPSQELFERLIAMQILFKEVLRVVSPLCSNDGISNYRAVVTCYTVSVYSHLVAQRFDFKKVWNDQRIDESTLEIFTFIYPHVRDVLLTGGTSKNRHVGEWAKKQDCWNMMIETNPGIPKRLLAGSHTGSKGTLKRPVKKIANIDSSTSELSSTGDLSNNELKQFLAIPPNAWFGIAEWAKNTSNLTGWQRNFSFNMGKLAVSGRTPSDAQLSHAMRILDEATRLGFDVET